MLGFTGNNTGGSVFGCSFPTNPSDRIIRTHSGNQKMESVSIIANPICFQINKHTTKMLQKQGNRSDAFAWIM
jgi:hypothetical protein